MSKASSPIRLLLLSQAPGVSGGERVTLPPLAKSTRLSVVVAGFSEVCRYAEELGLEAIELELPRAHRLTHPIRIMRGAASVKRIAREHQAQAIFANGTRAMPYAIGAKLISGIPVIVHHVGVLTSGPVRSLAFALRFLADLTVVSSRASAAQLRDGERVRVLPTGVDLGRFKPSTDKSEAKRAIAIPQGTAVVGTVTRADPRKGMGAFVELAEKLGPEADASFLLVGGATFSVEATHYGEITDRVARSAADIQLTGAVVDPVPYYQAMDVFVHLGEPEAFPTVALEAMACGIPVVAYGWGGIVEIIEEGKTGILVEPGNLVGAVKAVRELLESESTRAEMSALARARAENKFNLDRFADGLARAVVEVVDS